MQNISDLLKRFSNSLGRDVIVKEAVATCVKELLHFDLAVEDISIKENTLRIKTTPAKKSEINLHEAELLGKIRERTGQKISKILYN
jgi:hypothetical protein